MRMEAGDAGLFGPGQEANPRPLRLPTLRDGIPRRRREMPRRQHTGRRRIANLVCGTEESRTKC